MPSSASKKNAKPLHPASIARGRCALGSLVLRRPPGSPLFPYTTLFRSRQVGRGGPGDHVAGVLDVAGGVGDDELPPRRREVPVGDVDGDALLPLGPQDRKSTRLNSSHITISYAVFRFKKKRKAATPCVDSAGSLRSWLFSAPAPTRLSTLSLHDALPISPGRPWRPRGPCCGCTGCGRGCRR